ncbi:661_t:CDS:2 [Entrophospora sp. SA101]|nr:661_t:CDS:2 [Entrophospora sp. SA101]
MSKPDVIYGVIQFLKLSNLLVQYLSEMVKSYCKNSENSLLTSIIPLIFRGLPKERENYL